MVFEPSRAPEAAAEPDQPVFSNSQLPDSVLQLAALAPAGNIFPPIPVTSSSVKGITGIHCQVMTFYFMCYFAAELFRTFQPRSVHVYMSAIRKLHVEVGFTYPSGPMTLLARFLSGINRSSSTQRHRLLITTQLLREISRHVAFPRMWHRHDKAMLRAN